MPDGKTHLAAAVIALLPAAAATVAYHFLGLWPVVIAVAAYLIGTIWLSPDLDLKSQPYMAWGPLRWIWWPYMRMVPHRSWWSHGPVIGTLARVSVLVALSSIVVSVLVWQGVISLPGIRSALRIDLWALFSILSGLEVSALVHIGLDKVLKN
jgi:uncharacterized metal-binding protein